MFYKQISRNMILQKERIIGKTKNGCSFESLCHVVGSVLLNVRKVG